MISLRTLGRRVLAEPGTGDLDIDDPATTAFRRRLIRRKPFLKAIYSEWYSLVGGSLPEGGGSILEVGSGAGFLPDVVPNVITSEIFPLRDLDLAIDACALPFQAATLRALVLIDVLHHVPRPRDFLSESVRVLRPGGRLIMVEPWVTRWSRVIYGSLHHEPFRPEADSWEFPAGGPLSGANGALPWIMFERDRAVFEKEYPQLRVETLQLMMPFRYLLSGGVSMRAVVPSWTFLPFRRIEDGLKRFMPSIAMFAFIVVEKR